jgi:predicted protein tyrosine phosphatase
MIKKPRVLNCPRAFVQSEKARGIGKENTVWISIFEPECANLSLMSLNAPLAKLPTLFVSFWDIQKELPAVDGSGMMQPPSVSDAKQIVDFILKHSGKDIIVNCAAGISRSGAVAKFCEDQLGYDWVYSCKRTARPNGLLYNLMVEYFASLKL